MEQQLLIASIAILTQGYTVYVENVQILIRNVKRHQDANVTTYKSIITVRAIEYISKYLSHSESIKPLSVLHSGLKREWQPSILTPQFFFK